MWGWYAWNRLWQQTIEDDASEAIAEACSLGLALRPVGYRARVVAEGQLDGRAVRVVWRGGVRGPHCLVRVDRRGGRTDFLSDGPALRRALE